MKKFYFLLAALVVVIMTSCVKFKTEATVDVEVLKAGKPVSGVAVYKFKDNGLAKKARRPIQAALRISISNRRMISTRAM